MVSKALSLSGRGNALPKTHGESLDPGAAFHCATGLGDCGSILRVSRFKSRLVNGAAFLTIVHRGAVELGIDIDRAPLSYSIHSFKEQRRLSSPLFHLRRRDRRIVLLIRQTGLNESADFGCPE
jgi:hypothetical protein